MKNVKNLFFVMILSVPFSMFGMDKPSNGLHQQNAKNFGKLATVSALAFATSVLAQKYDTSGATSNASYLKAQYLFGATTLGLGTAAAHQGYKANEDVIKDAAKSYIPTNVSTGFDAVQAYVSNTFASNKYKETKDERVVSPSSSSAAAAAAVEAEELAGRRWTSPSSSRSSSPSFAAGVEQASTRVATSNSLASEAGCRGVYRASTPSEHSAAMASGASTPDLSSSTVVVASAGDADER